MIERDRQIAAFLDLLVPEPAQIVDGWQRIAADAGFARGRGAGRTRSPRRLLLVVCALVAVVVLLVPLIAFATGHGWWWQQESLAPGSVFRQLKPVSGVPSVIATGEKNGRRWTAVAYLSRPRFDPEHREMVCMTTIIGSLSNSPNGTGCGVLKGMQEPAGNGGGALITYGEAGGAAVGMVTGAVASDVSHVVLDLAAGGTIEPRLQSVSAVGDGVRFFAVQATMGGIAGVKLYDKAGTLLQRLPVRSPAPGHAAPAPRSGNHFAVPVNFPVAGRKLIEVGSASGPYGARATIKVGAIVSYRSSKFVPFRPTRCWEIGFSDGQSQGGCTSQTKRNEPEYWFGIEHVGSDTFVFAEAEPRKGLPIVRIDLQLANGQVLTAQPVFGIVVFAVPRAALSTSRSQRGFLVGYDKNGRQVSYYNAYAGVRSDRQAVYYRSCLPGKSTPSGGCYP